MQKNKIRILPMSLDDPEFIGWDLKKLQEEYFEDRLPNKEKGWYNYVSKGLNALEGDLILFQCQKCIIASAIFEQKISFPKSKQDEFKGSMVVRNIKTFKVINNDEFNKLLSKEISFTNAMHEINYNEIDIEKLGILMEICHE